VLEGEESEVGELGHILVRRIDAEDPAGLADAIVDLVSTGATLRANRLVEVEQIAPISSRLIVNQAAYKMRHQRLAELIGAIGKAVAP